MGVFSIRAESYYLGSVLGPLICGNSHLAADIVTVPASHSRSGELYLGNQCLGPSSAAS